jgi:hypothetical protein
MWDAMRAGAGIRTESRRPAHFDHDATTADPEWPGRPFSDSEEVDLAVQLLEARESRQLDRFLGRLMHRATRSFGGVGNPRLGRVLGGMLKSLARVARPGGGPDSTGVSPLAPESEVSEEGEFEAARRFVRFAGEAARRFARGPSVGSPIRHARSALRAAARRHAPGFLRHRRPRHPGSLGINSVIEGDERDRTDPSPSSDSPTCDDSSIRVCRCKCQHRRGSRVIVFNL